MKDFERSQRWTAEEIEASGMASALDRGSRAGDDDIQNLGYSRYVEDQLSGPWGKEGYEGVAMFVERKLTELRKDRTGLTMFVDDKGMPIAIAHLREEDDQNVHYRFFVDKYTHEVTLPRELTGAVSEDFRDDRVLYDLTDPLACMEVLLLRDENEETDKIRKSMEWLEARFGKKLTSKYAQENPYLANEDRVVAVRLDAITPDFNGDSSHNPDRF